MFSAVLIYILAVMSPGPNFILVSRFSAANSVLAGIGASIGIWMVGLLFSTSSVLGLAVIIYRFPMFGAIATILGALYLIYIAYTLLRSTLTPQPKTANAKDIFRVDFYNALVMGIVTNITNMKTIAFMVSIFASFLSTSKTVVDKITVIAICSSFELLWYSLVALIFGYGIIRHFYLKNHRQIDTGLAVFLLFFALQNILSLYHQSLG
jgi:threonine efflux protein